MSEPLPFTAVRESLPCTASGWRHYVLALALPIVLSNATVPLVGIVDTAVAGRMPSPVYVSAVSVGTIIYTTLFFTFGFLRMATSGLIAQSMGGQRWHEIHTTTRRAVLIGAMIGVILTVSSIPILDVSLTFMGGSTRFQELTRDYFQIRILSAPAALAMSAMIGALIGRRQTRSVMVLQIVLNTLNVVLTLLLFNITDWQVRGIAWATVLAEYGTLALGAWLLRDSLARVRLSDLRQIFSRQELASYLTISSHIMVRTMCLTGAFFWMTMMGSRQGELVLAANAILLQLVHFMSFALDGFAHAAEALTGQALGQRNVQVLAGAVRAIVEWSLGISLGLTLLYGIGGGFIIDTLTTQEVVRAAARDWLPWIVAAPFVCVWSYLLDGIFIGATHTREMRNGMVVSVLIFVLSSLLLVPLMGNHGLWLSYMILMLARAVTLGARYPRIVIAATAA